MSVAGATGRRRVWHVGTDPARAGAPHPRRSDRDPRRAGSRRAAPGAQRGVSGGRSTPAPGRQGLFGLVRRQPLLHPGPPSSPSSDGRGAGHPDHGGHSFAHRAMVAGARRFPRRMARSPSTYHGTGMGRSNRRSCRRRRDGSGRSMRWSCRCTPEARRGRVPRAGILARNAGWSRSSRTSRA
jgi:hypothetical protein